MQKTDSAKKQTPTEEASSPVILANGGLGKDSGYLPEDSFQYYAYLKK